jgi:hypothetical protein
MTDAQSYFDGLIAQGYTADDATNYTKQHFPNFGLETPPMAAAPVASAMVAPVAAAPMAAAPMAAAPMAAAPMAAAPMAAAPESSTSPLGWVAVGCIALTLIFSIMGQFGTTWLVDDLSIEDDGMSGELSTSLSEGYTLPDKVLSPSIDGGNVTMVEADWTKEMCKAMADPDNGTSCEGETMVSSFSDLHDLCSTSIKQAKDNGATDEMLKDSTESCDEIGAMASAGSSGGMILWVGILAALAATVLIVFNMLGMEVIPVDTQKFGMITGIAAGVLIGVAVLVWYLLLPEGDSSAGMSLWVTIIGSVTGIAGGVLTKTHGNQ